MDVDQNRTEHGSLYGAAPSMARAEPVALLVEEFPQVQAAKIQAALQSMHCVIGAAVPAPPCLD